MTRKHDGEPALDKMLRAYRVPFEMGEDAVALMARAARVRAVRIMQDLDQKGFLGLVAGALGFRRTAPVVWSALAGMTAALIVGVSLGVSGAIPATDEQAFSVDFDSVLGTGAMTGAQEEAL